MVVQGQEMMFVMGLSTAFTELFSVQHPIALAPMGGSAGGALAAAVSNGGGLGLLGGGNGDLEWLDRELPIVADGTDRPWGIGFQSWAIDVATVEHALAQRPTAVMLSFGEPQFKQQPTTSGRPVMLGQTVPREGPSAGARTGRFGGRSPLSPSMSAGASPDAGRPRTAPRAARKGDSRAVRCVSGALI